MIQKNNLNLKNISISFLSTFLIVATLSLIASPVLAIDTPQRALEKNIQQIKDIKINEIYNGSSDVMQWNEVSKRSALDIMNNSIYSKAFGKQFNASTEPTNRMQIKKYLTELRIASGEVPSPNETVDMYINRTLKKIIQTGQINKGATVLNNNSQTSGTPSATISQRTPSAVIPSTASNDGIVPCDGVVKKCTFDRLLEGVNNLIKALVTIAIPLAGLAFAYAGWLYITGGSNPSKREEAHQIFGSVIIGLFFILGAWLIVTAILKGLGVDSKIYSDILK